MPVPSVSLGLGNDLDPKFARWLISGGIAGFLFGRQLSRGDAWPRLVPSTWSDAGHYAHYGRHALVVFDRCLEFFRVHKKHI